MRSRSIVSSRGSFSVTFGVVVSHVVDQFPAVGAGEAVDDVPRPVGPGLARRRVVAGLGAGESRRTGAMSSRSTILGELVVHHVLVAGPGEDLLGRIPSPRRGSSGPRGSGRARPGSVTRSSSNGRRRCSTPTSLLKSARPSGVRPQAISQPPLAVKALTLSGAAGQRLEVRRAWRRRRRSGACRRPWPRARRRPGRTSGRVGQQLRRRAPSVHDDGRALLHRARNCAQ